MGYATQWFRAVWAVKGSPFVVGQGGNQGRCVSGPSPIHSKASEGHRFASLDSQQPGEMLYLSYSERVCMKWYGRIDGLMEPLGYLLSSVGKSHEALSIKGTD